VIEIEQIIKEVSKNTGVDIDIVSTICKHPFIYTMNVMKDKEDTKDILFNKLLKFKLKRRFKEDKSRRYSK
jgi:hypothetical protein